MNVLPLLKQAAKLTVLVSAMGVGNTFAQAPSPSTDQDTLSELVDELPPLDVLPELIHFKKAEYPAEELKTGIEGTVTLSLLINEKGIVDSSFIDKGISTALDAAAQKASLQFLFTPAQAGNDSVAVYIQYEYTFSISALAQNIEAVENFTGELIEKGTRNPIKNSMVVIRFPDTTRTLTIPLSSYLTKIGSFEGQELIDGTITTTTDETGHFSFKSLPAGPVEISFPVSGYKMTKSIESIESGIAIDMLYRLRKESYNQYEIVVYGKADKTEVAKKTLSIQEITKIPGFGGDAVKVVRAMPGVARPSFVTGDIIIRGAGPEDNGVYLDGVRLPRVFHFGGLKSTYNSALLSSVDMYPGGFGTRYGGATGGIIELKGRPAKMDRIHGEVDVNFFDATLMVEGPVTKKVGVQLAGRYSYMGKVIESVTQDMPMAVVPSYWDILGRVDYERSKSNRFFLTYNSSRDGLELLGSTPRGGSDEASENSDEGGLVDTYHVGILGWDYSHKKIKNELRLSAVYSNSTTDFFGFFNTDFSNYNLTIRDELNFSANDYVKINTGFDNELSLFEYDLAIMGAQGPQKTSVRKDYSRYGNYANVEISPIQGLKIIPGLRYDYFQAVNEGAFGLRSMVRYEYLKGLSIKGAMGTYSQLPTPVGQSIDSDWGNPDLPLTTGVHRVIGHEWQLNELISLDVQGYYNTQKNLARVSDSLDTSTGAPLNFEGDMEGRSYGMELMLRHAQGGRFFGWISYTLARSERRAPKAYVPGYAQGGWKANKWQLYEKDQTHNFQAIASWKLPAEWEVGFRFRYITGNPETPHLGITDNKYHYDSDRMQYTEIMGELNSDRVEDFIQLDVRADKKFIFDSWILSAYVDVKNANYFFYNSPEEYQYNYDFSKRETVGSLFLPTIGINAQF